MLRPRMCVSLCLVVTMFASCISPPKPHGSSSLAVQVRGNYDEALALMSNQEIDKEAKIVPEHFGMSIRIGALGEIVQRATLAGLLQRVSAEDHKLTLLGVNIPVGLSSKLVDLNLAPSKACPTCLKISGTLAGKYTFAKDFGEPDEYNSSFSMVAPLAFGPSDKGGAMYLDLSQVAQLGGFTIESKLSSIPEKLRAPLVKYLDTYIIQKVSGMLKPVKLMEFSLPSFGIEGLTFMPSDLSYDMESKTVAMTLHSNIKTPAHRIDSLRQLGPDDVFGVGVHLGLLTRLLNASMAQESTPYAYTATGGDGGPFHVVPLNMNALADENNVLTQVALDFDVFRFDADEDASRGSFRAVLTPKPNAQGTISWSVSEVVPMSAAYGPVGINVEGWRNAKFLKTMTNWLKTATGAPVIPVPGVRAASFGAKGLQVEGKGVSAMFGLGFEQEPVDGGEASESAPQESVPVVEDAQPQ